jgi:hypothetical protein
MGLKCLQTKLTKLELSSDADDSVEVAELEVSGWAADWAGRIRLPTEPIHCRIHNRLPDLNGYLARIDKFVYICGSNI